MKVANKDLQIKISSAVGNDISTDGYDLLGNDKKLIPKIVEKDEIVKYKPVSRDYVKVDRWVIDLVIPFLNSKCSPGVSVLYLDLYRMTYGYGNNKLNITDELIERRVSIPKRTIMAHKKELIKYDLIKYKKGHRTRRGEFIIKRPEQSVYFKDYIQKTVSLPTKSVGSTEKNSTLYNKDNVYIDSETLVFDFYDKAGWKKTSITRALIDSGVKTLNKLYQQGYKEDLLKDLVDWSIKYCNDNHKPIYGIGFISFLLPEYLASKEKIANQKVKLKEEKKLMVERDNEIEREDMIMGKYNLLPKHMKSMILVKAKQMADDELKDKDIGKFSDYTEKYMIEANIVVLMESGFVK